ncbi:DUF3488 domain-containing protein [Cohnella panacarvi]|uniref:DUF3488 domain-containing protein n=1 Tax=Cohnella panacarvi TaxID=400776 RepID=UPI00047C319A|nr:hypothetical protein [Cohnella panacarvi]
MKARDVRTIAAWIAAVGSAVLILWLLMIPPVLGLADSGDFARVMVGAGIAPLDPNESYDGRYFGFSHQYYGYGDYMLGGYFSTHVLLVAIAGWLGRIVSLDHFDMRVLGCCYAALYIWAIVLLIRSSPKVANRKATLAVSAALAACLVFVFGDIGYIVYFQSFFGEPYALIATLLTVGAALVLLASDRPSGAMLAIFICAALALATSKIQNAPLGFAFALLAWRMLKLREDRTWRKQAWTGVIVLVVCSALMIVVAPDRLKHTNLYQSIFFGVLKSSPDVASDMEELGIPDKYAGLAGTNYFQKNTVIPQSDPVLHREVLEKLSHKDIAMYYLRHPSRFIQKLEVAASNGVYIRPLYLGNYDQSAQKPRGAVSHAYSAWSQWKVKKMPHTLGIFLMFYAFYYLALAWIWLHTASRRLRLGLETMAIIGIAGAFAVFVAIIGDGEADMGKHLFMFNVCFDMMVVSIVVSMTYFVTKFMFREGRKA